MDPMFRLEFLKAALIAALGISDQLIDVRRSDAAPVPAPAPPEPLITPKSIKVTASGGSIGPFRYIVLYKKHQAKAEKRPINLLKLKHAATRLVTRGHPGPRSEFGHPQIALEREQPVDQDPLIGWYDYGSALTLLDQESLTLKFGQGLSNSKQLQCYRAPA